MAHQGARRSAEYQAAVVRYSAALRAAMRARGIHRDGLAAAIGVSGNAVGAWMRAVYMPRPDIGQRVADYLGDDRLLVLATLGRKIRCAMCQRVIFRGHTRRRYCGEECWERSRSGKAGVPPGASVERAAIDAFCQGCEPEGFCRTPECVLQPFSPLPLVEMHRLGVA